MAGRAGVFHGGGARDGGRANARLFGDADMKNYVLAVSYDGTDFSGWQIQRKGRTVQGVLEEAAFSAFGKVTKI